MAEKPEKPELNLKQVNKRLTSLARPRDLLLSAGVGTSKPKKVFTPNLNAVRNKGKAIPNLVSDSNRRNPKKQQKEFKKRESDTPRYVQSTGIFSEGTNESKRELAHASRSYEARDGGGEASAGMEKPKIDTDAVWNIDLDEEAKVLSNLLDDAGIQEDEPVHDQYQPVVLPMERNKENFFKTFAPKNLLETKIKQEVADVDEKVDTNKANLTNCSFNLPISERDSNVSYSIVKLPDSMPGKGFDEEGKVIDYTLDQMNEGRIGRLVKRKSGKIEIIIGEMRFDLSSVEASPFTEELMVLPHPEEPEENATMTNLGPIKERFIFSPSWQSLLSKPDT